jgi:hypothetical protein
MMIRLAAAVLLTTPLALHPAPAHSASEAAAENRLEAYGELVDAIAAGQDITAIIDNVLAATARQFADIPEIAIADKLSPGLIAEAVEALRPTMQAIHTRVEGDYRDRWIDLFAAELTPEEARGLAAFYRSDLGTKVMASFSRNFTYDATLANVSETSTVSEQQVAQDLKRTTAGVLAELSLDDIEAMGRAAADNPALLKLAELGPKMTQLRTIMENEQPTPDEEAAISAAIEAVFARRFPDEG